MIQTVEEVLCSSYFLWYETFPDTERLLQMLVRKAETNKFRHLKIQYKQTAFPSRSDYYAGPDPFGIPPYERRCLIASGEPVYEKEIAPAGAVQILRENNKAMAGE